MPADQNAFQLAVDELHEHIGAEDVPADELLESARWLRDLPNCEDMPVASRALLSAGITTLTNAAS